MAMRLLLPELLCRPEVETQGGKDFSKSMRVIWFSFG